MRAFPTGLSLLASGFLAAASATEEKPFLAGDNFQFIDSHCASCHDDVELKGGIDLYNLKFDPSDPVNFERWVKVFDRATAGEMPPEKKPRPDAAELRNFADSLSNHLIRYERDREARYGRATQRRLNRYEYENVVRDLLQTPWLQLKDILPEDPVAYHYNKIGEALDVSHVQMARYLEAAEFALRDVVAKRIEAPEKTVTRYYAREQDTFLKHTWKFTNEQERTVIPVLGFQAQYELYGPELHKPMKREVPNDPVIRELSGFVGVSSQYGSYYMWFDSFNAPAAGRYKLRFKTFSAWVGPSRTEPGIPNQWWIPDLSNVMPSHRAEPITVYAETYPRKYRLIGKFDAQIEPSIHEIETNLLEGETIHPDNARFFRPDFDPARYRNPLATREGSPAVGYRWLEVEGPLYDQWPSAGHRLMFGDLPLSEIVDPDTGRKTVEAVSRNPKEDATRLLRNFIEKAYRYPVSGDEYRRFLPVFEGVMEAGDSFTEAMITAYTAVLCSPQFLMLKAEPGPLDDYAIAERLSFFLQNTAPDSELRAVAAAGRLRDPAVLRAQTERLLDSPEADEFVDAFTDYWLELRKVASVSPDPVLYNDFHLDDLLNESALEETKTFVSELIRQDLPARNVVDSDFVMVNEKLATLYDIPGVEGVGIRRVPVPADSPRGGLITQASILKVTTDGNNTSPVKRGAWVLDRILGKPASPPPNVPAVEADTRGATTLRQLLELHRDQTSCASCHQNIDPPGFALENFDVLGAWRERYRALDADVEPVEGFGRIGQKLEFHYALPVDAAGEMPDGTPFSDIKEFKRILLEDEAQLARNLASQLTVYATGAPVRFSDRPAIEEILSRAKGSGYGFRTLIHEIVQSELFLNK